MKEARATMQGVAQADRRVTRRSCLKVAAGGFPASGRRAGK